VRLTTEKSPARFLTSAPTIAQRIVRRESENQSRGHSLSRPLARGFPLPDRLDGVLQVIYLMFNEGYAASSGQFDHPRRPIFPARQSGLGRVARRIASRT